MQITDESVEQVASFKFLGFNISSNINCCQEVKQRMAMAKEASGREAFSVDTWKKTKEEASEVFVCSVALYSAEIWTLRRNEQK